MGGFWIRALGGVVGVLRRRRDPAVRDTELDARVNDNERVGIAAREKLGDDHHRLREHANLSLLFFYYLSFSHPRSFQRCDYLSYSQSRFVPFCLSLSLTWPGHHHHIPSSHTLSSASRPHLTFNQRVTVVDSHPLSSQCSRPGVAEARKHKTAVARPSFAPRRRSQSSRRRAYPGQKTLSMSPICHHPPPYPLQVRHQAAMAAFASWLPTMVTSWRWSADLVYYRTGETH